MPESEYVKVITPDGKIKSLPHPRPVHVVNGKKFVTYKKKRHALLDGNLVDLRHRRATRPMAATQSSIAGKPASRSQKTSDEEPPDRKEITKLDEQAQIIAAPPDARILVDAGPGAGKSHVACARIVELVRNYRIQASRIWMISFTRTAVREIRDRISLISGETDSHQLRGLQPRTLDSLAARLRLGIGDVLAGGFNENIVRFTEQISENSALKDQIAETRHVLIDEAQDIVGERADLVCTLIKALPESCGITIFADPAQAIYGFSEGEVAEQAETLLERIGQMGFGKCYLTGQHRTDAPNLLEIFGPVRRRVLDPDIAPAERHAEVLSRIETLADESRGNVEDLENLDDDCFVLFRRRIDVLAASSRLNGKGIPHRLRLSGLPTVIEPWIGGALSLASGARLSESQFSDLWDQQVRGTEIETVDRETAWERLLGFGGDNRGRLILADLREVLLRRPPLDLCTTEFGASGPILGTIHAAKGREAKTVHLRISNAEVPEDQDDEVTSEETRVIYVGATRARQKLFVGKAVQNLGSRVLETGRAYRIGGGKKFAQAEIGRREDLAAEGVVGTSAFATVEEALQAQCMYPGLSGEKLIAKKMKIGGFWPYVLFLSEETDGPPLGLLSKAVAEDMFTISKEIGSRRSPSILPHLHVVGCQTLVASDRNRLLGPWRESGMAIAPLVIGLTYFKRF